MKTIKVLVLLLIGTTIINCSSDNGDNNGFDLEDLSGNWFGTFEGDDSGTWGIFAYPDGRVTGTANSNNLQQTLAIEGNIDKQGNLDAVLGSAENGATFTGKFTTTRSSGSWNNPESNVSGSWSGERR